MFRRHYPELAATRFEVERSFHAMIHEPVRPGDANLFVRRCRRAHWTRRFRGYGAVPAWARIGRLSGRP